MARILNCIPVSTRYNPLPGYYEILSTAVEIWEGHTQQVDLVLNVLETEPLQGMQDF